MSSPRVGYVIKRFPRLSETFVLRELLELERLGLDLTILALGRADEPVVHADYARLAARVYYADELPAPAGSDPGTSKDARHASRFVPLVRDLGLTHLHAHFATSAAGVARRIGAEAGIPFSFTAHAKDIFHESVSQAELDALIAAAAFVVTVSDYNIGYLREVSPSAMRTPLHRIYNGVDLERFPSPSAERADDRILAIGRLVEKKGFDVFIDAVAALHAARPSIRATLIGTGRCEADLRARIAALGLTGTIDMAGAQPQDAVLEAMRQHTLLAVPCVVSADGDRDGLPTVITEALASGLPVVATPVTGIPEIVRHGETGLLVPERNAALLADAMATLLADADLRQRLALAGRVLVEQQFDAQRNAEVLLTLFTEASRPVTPAPMRAPDLELVS